MIIQRIPLIPNISDQQVTVVLNNNPYFLRVVWNERFGCFHLSTSQTSGELIIGNIKMVTMYNLTFRFVDDHMPLGDFYFIREKGPYKRPAFEDLGVTTFLWYVSPEDSA